MPTPQEFIEEWPLYTKADILGFNPPESITRMCRRCKKETTWSRKASDSIPIDTDPNRTFQYVAYSCVLCGKDSVLVLYQLLDWKQRGPNSTNYSHHAVKKVGQEPAASIEIPADLSERLGATGEHYKKALVCRNSNYGIGAVAYMRRVIEEKTDELIDVVIELAQTYGVDTDTLESLMMAKEQARYEDKLRIASELIPSAVRPEGVNPVGQLYIHLSIGLHGKTDDECIAIFDDLKADFEYVFRNLHVQAEDRREFVQRVKERAGRKT
jgi:hypothetical protein